MHNLDCREIPFSLKRPDGGRTATSLFDRSICPRRVLAQTAQTRGGILEVPAYRQDYFSVAEKSRLLNNRARKVLPKSTQGIAETSLGVEHSKERNSEEER